MGLEVKRKKVYSNSVGNKLLYNQISRHNVSKVVLPKQGTQEEMLRCLQRNRNCCSVGKHYLGCVGLKFVDPNSSDETVDMASLFSYIQQCRDCTRFKINSELKQFIKDVYEEAEVSQSNQRTIMNYRLPIFSSTYVTKHNNKVCRKGITAAYGFSVKALQTYSASKKAGKVGSFLKKVKRLSESTVFERTFNDLESVFQDNVIDYSPLDNEMVRSALVPSNQQFCSVWLENHFTIYGDKAPNKLEIQLSVNSKKEIYELFVEEVKKNSMKPVAYNTFVNLWNAQFPNVKARPWVDVPGKCNTCYLIDREKGKATDQEVVRHLGLVHQLHRGGLYMLEREKYYKRIAYALNNKATVMSIIIDGMDQNHCRIPYLGSQNQFGSPISQGITGIKEHGIGFFIYRTVGNVKKSPDLSMYCILSQLECWVERNKRFPEELLIQVDGGSENANKTLLAMLELLVTKRLVRVIQFSRLPVGHTHEDIDACFAQVWSLSRGSSCLTLDEYRDKITNRLKNTKIPTTFKDVYVIPSYKTLLEGCIDSHLKLLHKWPYTQHCWRFEAVMVSDSFKFGCKTTYKAYCSDKVVEIQSKMKSQCYSIVGQYTGLEPITVYCPWYPKENGVEGTYLLRKIPNILATPQEIAAIPPAPFCEKGVEQINQCLLEVKRKFIVGEYEKELSWWIDWEKQHVPVLTSAVDYVQKLKQSNLAYRLPLAGYLFGKLTPVDAVWRSKLSTNSSDINQNFQWPEVLATATQSVSTDFHRNVPEPRAIMVNQNELIDTLREIYVKVNAYYASLFTSSSVNAIKIKLNQKVQPSGKTMATSGESKTSLIEMWKQHDHAFVEAIFNKLSPLQLRIVEPFCLSNNVDIDVLTLSQKNNISFSGLIIQEINGELPLQSTGMNTLLKLFRVRDEIAVRNNSLYKPSLFIDVESCMAIMNYNINNEVTDMLSLDVQLGNLTKTTLDKLSRIYFPYLHSDGVWGLVIIDFKFGTLYYVYHHGIQGADPELDMLLEQISKQFSMLLTEFNGPDTYGIKDWDISLYPLNGSSCSEEFSGIFIATVLYYILQECPIYIPASQLTNMKQKFAYWLISGVLPM